MSSFHLKALHALMRCMCECMKIAEPLPSVFWKTSSHIFYASVFGECSFWNENLSIICLKHFNSVLTQYMW